VLRRIPILISTVGISAAMRHDQAEEKAMRKILGLIFSTSFMILIVTVIGWYVSLPIYLGLIAATLLTSIALAIRVW
jgi:hypothetical protein